jgi:hypothetical protein
MRRFPAAAALAAITLSLVVPLASAHNEQYGAHSMAWGASPNPTTANDGAQVYSIDEVVAAKAHFVDGVRSWDVVIRPVNGGQPSSCHEDLATDERGKYPTDVYINCPWDTTRATKHTLPGRTPGDQADDPKFARVWESQDFGPSVNGKYVIEITAVNAAITCGALLTPCGPDERYVSEPHPLHQSNSNPPRWREVWVVNGVAQPNGVNSRFDPATNRISVTWAPNPEPDVSYIVQEKVGDGKWSAGAGVPGNATRYERAIEQPGTYQYRVAAVRPAPTRDGSDAAKKSDFVTAAPIEIAQVTPPTTAGANAADGAPDTGGGDPGVFIPGDTPTTTGAPGGTRGSRPPGPGPSSSPGRFSGPAPTGFRPSGSAPRSTGTTAGEYGEAEGEGPDGGFSAVLPYDQPREQFAEDDGLGEEAGPETLAGVVPKPRDTRQLLIYMAISLTLFVFAMQLTVLVRRSKPTLATAEQYQDDFDDWLGGF